VGFGVVRALQPADPRVIGPYRLVGQLGAGGMGRVFLGMSAGGRPVAVKIIRAELAADPEFRTRFSREVAAARRVNGLFTALVVDADVDATVPWLATAFVPAPSLAETVNERGPLSARAVLSLAAGLAEGLTAIHAAGVVHGDLKPSNVLLAEDGPRVIDFGISQAAGAAPVTPTGLVVGSPGFMSPEQAMGRNVGPLSDVFSLGAVLAFAATGKRPFGTGSPVELLDRVVHGSARLDTVPADVLPLVERCLAKDPGRRPTAADLLAEMGAVHFATDWLPESIVRMIPMDIPATGDDDRMAIVNVGGTWTVTLGSAEHDVGSASGQARLGTRYRPDGVPQPGGEPQPDADNQSESDDQPQLGHQPEPQLGDLPEPQLGQPQTADQPQSADGQLQTGDQTQAGDQPQAGDRQTPRSPWYRALTAVGVIALLAAAGVTGYTVTAATRHLSGASSPSQTASTAPTSPTTFASAPPHASASGAPQITSTYTYQQGVMVNVVIYYADPGDKADGFGFMGAKGSSLAEQSYPFSSPSEGIVEPGSITYPFNQQCGTPRRYTSNIKAWIYDAAGRSRTVPIHLVCAT
jgi:serine/threonine protein kinase